MCFQVWSLCETSTSIIPDSSNLVCFGSTGGRPRICQCLLVVGLLPEKISMWLPDAGKGRGCRPACDHLHPCLSTERHYLRRRFGAVWAGAVEEGGGEKDSG